MYYLAKLSVRGLVLSGRVYYDVHCCLSRDGRTQANRQQLEKLGLDLCVHVQHLHVASTETTPTTPRTEQRQPEINSKVPRYTTV